MAALAAATAVVGVLCVLDLLLTLGVVRRLREHTEMLNRTHPPASSVMGLSAGQMPSAFSGVSVEGVPVAGPAGLRLVAFFSTKCSVCPERVPALADFVRDNQLRRSEVLAIVTANPGDEVPYLDRLTQVSQVCVESVGGELAAAFQLAGYPAFCLLDAGGVALATSFDPADLPAPVPA
jgi:hypothetical protein